MPKLIDVHTHTHFAAYENPREVIDRALRDNIWIINVGTQRDTSSGAVKIAQEYKEGVYAAIGLHPIHTDKSFHDEKELGGGEAAKAFTSRGEEFDFEYYRQLGKSSKVVAIGECGLDYYRLSEESKERQFRAFEAQIQLANDLKKPLMIHCRSAFNDLIKLLNVNRQLLNMDTPGVIHFFAGTKDDARMLMDLGFSFSFGGVATFPPKSGVGISDYDEVIKYIGIGRIVLETDAPYVTPIPFRGKRNEPVFLLYIAEAVGRILGVDADVVAEKTTENAKKIFKI